MNLPITQSKSWADLQAELGKTSFLKEEKNFAFLAIEETTPIGNYIYVPYGPIYGDKTGLKKALKTIETYAKTSNAFFIRLEPQNPDFVENLPKNAKKTKDLNPKDTWRLDLTPDEKTLLSNFSQGTRTRHNTYVKKGLSVAVSKNPADIHYLVELQSALAARKNIQAYAEDYLRAELAQPFASLYLVKYNPPETDPKNPKNPKNPESPSKKPTPKDGEVIAASLFFDFDDTRYYMQSAANSDYRHLPATVALLSKAIFDAKGQGIKTFDFWGIAPDGAPKTHPWAGFTEFKKSFGGYPVHYAGTYDLVLNKTKYRLYQLLRRLNRLRRKI